MLPSFCLLLLVVCASIHLSSPSSDKVGKKGCGLGSISKGNIPQTEAEIMRGANTTVPRSKASIHCGGCFKDYSRGCVDVRLG